MPQIDITMGDPSVSAAADSGVVDVSVGFAGAYTDADAVAAMDGATVTPASAGTASDPVGSTHTEELYGTEEGINLANPLHRVYSDSTYFHTFFQTIDTWQQVTSGSGSVNSGQYYVKLATNTTSGSSASLFRTVNNDINKNFGTVDSERVFRVEANFRHGVDARTTYITNGKLQNGGAGFGIKAANGKIMGVLNDGTAESTVDLATPTAGEHYGADLMCRYDPVGTVEFFIDKTKQGELSHNLGDFDGRAINFYLENTSGVDRQLWFSEFRMGIAP